MMFVFFFKQKTAYEMRISDWSSDVCSSDLVEVDRLGEARAVEAADAEYRATDPQVAWHLSRFITNVRSVSLDPVLMRRDWLEAYDFATKRGARFLGEYARAASPFADVGERPVSVQVTSVVRASDKSFQVKWTATRSEERRVGKEWVSKGKIRGCP